MRVEKDGVVLAESSRALVLSEKGLPDRYYLPRGRVTVTVTIVTADGRTVRQTRRYRICTPRRG